MKPRILVVEDEPTISEPLAEHLERDGFAAEVAGTIAEALEAYRRQAPDLILLDVMLPDGDGRDLCRDIRKESDVPIVMLTARGEEIDRVLGLELGADDYVVKPFSARELSARVRAIMRRGKSTGRRGPIEVGSIVLDPAARTVTKDGASIELAAREFDLSTCSGECRPGRAAGTSWMSLGLPTETGPTKTRRPHLLGPQEDREDPSGAIHRGSGRGFRYLPEKRAGQRPPRVGPAVLASPTSDRRTRRVRRAARRESQPACDAAARDLHLVQPEHRRAPSGNYPAARRNGDIVSQATAQVGGACCDGCAGVVDDSRPRHGRRDVRTDGRPEIQRRPGF
jgi:CheY-like chemotaxis protein